MRAIFSRPWTVALALLALCAAAYGTLAPSLGYYWDDWTIVWYIHFLGPTSFKEAFAFDRPLLAPIYMLTTSVLGEAPLAWQLFAIFTRWLACLALWVTLRALWPRFIVEITCVTFLFAVYPGFKQQYIAITYGNAFLVLAFYLASWGLMTWAFRKPRWFWHLYLASILFSLYSVFTAEHFFGLEFLRPVFLWLVIGANNAGSTDFHYESKNSAGAICKRLQRSIAYWAPFLIIDIFFLVWRISNKTPRAQITIFEALKENPLATAIGIGQTALQDIIKSSVLAWNQTLNFSWLAEYSSTVVIKYSLIVLLVASFMAVFLMRLRAASEESDHLTKPDRRSWALQAIGIGMLALLLAGIPIWPTNLRIELFFPWDRFTLPMMFGVSLLLVGLIVLFLNRPWLSILLISIFAALASGMHFHNALIFRKDWLTQRDFFWQLTWRAPAIKPGTILLTSEMPFPFDWDNSLTTPLNWTYAPNLEGRQLPYLLYNAESRLSSGLPDLQKDTQIAEYLRITPFTGSISQTILFFYRPPGSCVKVIDPLKDQNIPDKPRYFRDIFSFSDPGLILQDTDSPAQPPLQFFGPEPEHDWCYLYEKAELSRQIGDWEEIASLGDRAFNQEKSFYRKNVSELIPFIEAYARVGRWERAYQLTMQAFKAWENSRTMLCNTWENLHQVSIVDPQSQSTYQQVSDTLLCQSTHTP